MRGMAGRAEGRGLALLAVYPRVELWSSDTVNTASVGPHARYQFHRRGDCPRPCTRRTKSAASANGQKFLASVLPEGAAPPVTVWMNWMAGIVK